MPRLIFNSDDYGRSANVSRGIREAHLQGVVTSTTAMMNLPTTVADLGLAAIETPRLGIGVHLVLTSGKPVLSPERVPSLVTAEGKFFDLATFTHHREHLVVAEIQAEWRAQIEKFVQATGRAPTHLDSHHHASYFLPAWFRAMLELAREYNCAIRQPIPSDVRQPATGLPTEVSELMKQATPTLLAEFNPRCPTAFFATFYDHGATQTEVERLIATLPASGDYEIMCHPGYSDPDLVASTIYATQRERELAILTSPATRAALDQHHIELITFADL